MRGFFVDNLKGGKSKYGVDIQGLDNAPIYDVRIANSSFENVADGNIIKNLKSMKIENVKINGKLVNDLK
jgi:hypothetical protein